MGLSARMSRILRQYPKVGWFAYGKRIARRWRGADGDHDARHAVRQDLRQSCADRDPVDEPVGLRDALAVETPAGAAATAGAAGEHRAGCARGYADPAVLGSQRAAAGSYGRAR